DSPARGWAATRRVRYVLAASHGVEAQPRLPRPREREPEWACLGPRGRAVAQEPRPPRASDAGVLRRPGVRRGRLLRRRPSAALRGGGGEAGKRSGHAGRRRRARHQRRAATVDRGASMSNYSQEGRPALPLLQGVGNKGGEVTTGYAILRGARLLLAILNPVAVVAMWAFLIPLSHVRRLRAWRIVAAGAVATIAALLFGWIATYNTVWRELGNAAVDAARQRDTGVLLEVVTDQSLSWVIAPPPAAVCFGLLLACILL